MEAIRLNSTDINGNGKFFPIRTLNLLQPYNGMSGKGSIADLLSYLGDSNNHKTFRNRDFSIQFAGISCLPVGQTIYAPTCVSKMV